MRARAIGVPILVAAVLVGAFGCSSSARRPTAASSTTTNVAVPTSELPARSHALVEGTGTLDGRPFDAQFVGAVVLHDGLVTPCQVELPSVSGGRYAVPVYAESESVGCGAPGTKIALWTYAHDRIVFSTNTVAWPGDGRVATFAPIYSSARPDGAAPVAAQFTGNVRDAHGRQMPAGTRVDAYIGATRCGVASLRDTADYTGYVLSVVGAESVPGCTRGAAISFRVDGHPATSRRVVNTPPGKHAAVDITVS